MDQAQAWQKKVRDLFQTDITLMAMAHATRAIDTETLKRNPLPLRAFLVAFQNIKNRRHEITVSRSRDPEVDFDFDIVFFRDKGEWFAKAHTEQNAWVALWKEHFGGTTYDYWNNSDRPTDLSGQEWQLREQAWARMVGYNAPSDCGFGLSANTSIFLPDLKSVINRQPALEDRAHYFALESLRDEHVKTSGDQPNSDITRQLFEFSEWLRSKGGKMSVATRTKIIAASLNPHLILEDFSRHTSGLSHMESSRRIEIEKHKT
jgi:hypothetical protein